MNKKFIAILTALALVVTLLAPVGVQEASAKSDNWVDRVISVSDDATISDEDAPKLYIENDDRVTWEVYQTFRLTLPNDVEWNTEYINERTTFNAVGNEDNDDDDKTKEEKNKNVAKVTAVISKQTIEVQTVKPIDPGAAIIIPLAVVIDGAKGEIRVTIDARNSKLSSGSYTFAYAADGDTVATVGKKEKVSRGKATGATIVIDEVNAGSLGKGTHSFDLRLPSHFEWHDDMLGYEVLERDKDGKPTKLNFYKVRTPGANIEVVDVKISSNKRDLTVTVAVSDTSNARRSIIIDPVFIVTRDAKYGDIAVDITRTRGDITAQSGLVIAEYHDGAVVIEIDEVKEIVAGYWEDTNEFETAKIVIEETVENSLALNGVIEFTLPGWVRIPEGIDFTIENKTSNAAKKTLTNHAYIKNEKGEYVPDPNATNDFFINKDRNEFEINVRDLLEKDNNGNIVNNKLKLEFELPLTIEGTRTGDVELVVSGGGIDEQTIVVAKAIAPVTAEVEVRDVRIGAQGQPLADIIIKENVAGAIRDNGRVELKFANNRDQYFSFDGGTVFEVIEGDLKLDDNNHKKSGDHLAIGIDAESTTPSTIKVSNVKVTVDRNAPEGVAQLDIGGPALVNNGGGPGDFAKRVARFDFVNVITPAPGDVRATSVFTIDSTTYTVIESGQEVERTMDVAPYIKDSRTFLPVFFVAQSLGVPESNVIWEPHTKTVTVMKGDRIASMQIGNTVLTVNGTPIQMDTAPEIKDGRTMLPIYYVGQALGASVEWDGDARTVTVTSN